MPEVLAPWNLLASELAVVLRLQVCSEGTMGKAWLVCEVPSFLYDVSYSGDIFVISLEIATEAQEENTNKALGNS